MVAETPDIKAGGIKAGDASPADGGGNATADRGWWARSWIGRHWRGELPLDLAFWTNGFLVNVALGFLAWWLDHLFDYRYEFSMATTLFLLVFVSLFEKWLMAWGCLGNLAACLYGDGPKGPHADVALAVFAFTSAVMVWQIVGIWRSADSAPGRQLPDGRTVGRSLGHTVALLLMVVWIVVWLGQLTSVIARL